MSSSSRMTNDFDDNIQDMTFTKRGCCFCIPFFRSNSTTSKNLGWWERIRLPQNKEQWLANGWNTVKEWSELMTGCKWKTFIRRFKKNKGIKYTKHRVRYTKQGSYQYDSLSYARNFDDQSGDKRDEDYAYDFSSRYASVPTSAKSSMDLGKDGPSFE